MREIKFRAWVTRYDEPFMLYLKPNITWRDVENGLVVAFTEDGEDYGYAEVSSEKIDYPFMQYTGLKDKNGKEIYEGDVLLIDGKTTKVIESEMGWDWDGASVYGWAIGTENPETESEIIGNIYSNPELIEK